MIVTKTPKISNYHELCDRHAWIPKNKSQTKNSPFISQTTSNVLPTIIGTIIIPF